jgi:hypothetical protein
MDPVDAAPLETDADFPSGPWTGYFLQRWIPGRHTMTIDLSFGSGQLQGSGSDLVGPFTFQGGYSPGDARCQWVKQYLGKHQVKYTGINEGQGIWGLWEIRALGGLYKDQGAFHIWPEGMTPTEEAEAAVEDYWATLRESGRGSVVGFLLRAIVLVALLFLSLQIFAPRLWTGSSAPQELRAPLTKTPAGSSGR